MVCETPFDTRCAWVLELGVLRPDHSLYLSIGVARLSWGVIISLQDGFSGADEFHADPAASLPSWASEVLQQARVSSK